jgi:hypothetical protein
LKNGNEYCNKQMKNQSKKTYHYIVSFLNT